MVRTNRWTRSRICVTQMALVAALGPFPCLAQDVLPRSEIAPAIKVGRTVEESGQPAWPQLPRAPTGAPNVLLILSDDVGFGSSSTFGGLIPTPNLDALAANGIRYNRFNTTAICSPTRAALLTGREAHNAGMGNLNNFATAFDGYTSIIPKSVGMMPEVLRLNGYSTAAFGKWHITPQWEQSEVGPFDRWPTSEGFEYFYGFHSGDTDQYAPALYRDTVAIPPPTNDPNYILDRDLADQAITWIQHHHDLAPDKPFFVYYATPAAHAPHSAPKEWLDKFKGKFDQGWDAIREEIYERQKKLGIIPADAKLTPRPSFLPAWSSLSADQKRLYARMMEAYAASLAHSDYQIGRVIESLRASGQLDNTLIVFIEGDNGSSAEGGLHGLLSEHSFINGYDEDLADQLKHIDDIGGPRAYNHYPAGWAWAMDTPFQYYKQVASHFGGVRNGMVVSWPGHLKDPKTVRSQFLYVSDVMPTILEAAGVSMPSVLNGFRQKPLDGISFRYTFDHPLEPSHRHTQVFEMIENLGIYHDGWWAGTRPAAAPWDLTKGLKINLATREWELYHVADDFSQADNLAQSNPAKLAEMKDLFFEEAAKTHILPIHGNTEGAAGRPSLTDDRKVFVLHAGETRIPEFAAPRIVGKSYSLTADVVIPQDGASGVLITQGGRFGGYAFYVKDDRPVFDYNTPGDRHYTIRSSERLPPGPHKLAAEFAADSSTPGAGGKLTITVDGNAVASGRIEHTHRTWISASEGMDVGEDTLTPINDDYTIAESKFSGELRQLLVQLK